jgi:hypothetical protein
MQYSFENETILNNHALECALIQATQSGFRKFGEDLDPQEVWKKFLLGCHKLVKPGESLDAVKCSIELFVLWKYPFDIICKEMVRLEERDKE